MENIYFPEELKAIVKNKPFRTDNMGLSGSTVLVFDDMVLKIQPHSIQTDDEQKIMSWLQDKLSVPRCLYYTVENDTSYLLMSKIDGVMSCDEVYMQNPTLLTKLLADGLKQLWQIDVTDCPINRSLNRKLNEAAKRVKLGLVDIANTEPGTFGESGFATPPDLLNWLCNNQPEEEMGLVHGDYCLPNIFCKEEKVSGFIDIGGAGVGDKWQDIALCYRSLKFNFDGKYNGVSYDGFDPNLLFEELGIEPDWNKINFYILLDELF